MLNSAAQETLILCRIDMSENRYLIDLDKQQECPRVVAEIIRKIIKDIILIDQLNSLRKRASKVPVHIFFRCSEISNGARGKIKELTKGIVIEVTKGLINNKQTCKKILGREDFSLEIIQKDPRFNEDNRAGVLQLECEWSSNSTKTDSASLPA